MITDAIVRHLAGLLIVCLAWIGCLGLPKARAHATDPIVISWENTEVARTWRGGLAVTVALSDPTHYGIVFADDPRRLGIRLLSDIRAEPVPQAMQNLALEPTFEGSVLWVGLDKPMVLRSVEMVEVATGATLRILLTPAEEAEFETEVARTGAWTERIARRAQPEIYDDGRFHVMLDPGHGGHDPGAQHGGIREADLVLRFANELRAILQNRDIRVSTTRDADRFVPLAERVAAATRAGADVFVSLHADAVEVGRATGASIHTLPRDARDAADTFLLSRLGDDALRGTTPSTDDATAATLMELARRKTEDDSDALAGYLVQSMSAADIALYKFPTKQSNFVVLRAADVPSVLVELGFLSEPEDRDRLTDPAWRARMAEAIANGLLSWVEGL
ncbi:MAG: N-acetylmuramoyl-L-alanine amidase [Pseudomonadota bacterium]